jgi:hypothetical protein
MSDSRLYPQGSGVPKEQSFRTSTGRFRVSFGDLKFQRTRVTLAQANAGFTLLPALPGVKWCIRDAAFIAVGGAAAGGTSLDLLGTASGSAVRPLVAAVAGLTQNTLLRAGATNATILAAGASFTPLDVNTSVSVTKQSGGSALTTATHFDVFLWYTAEAP